LNIYQIIFMAGLSAMILAADGKVPKGGMDMKHVKALIIKNTPGLNSDANIDVVEKTKDAPYTVRGVRLFKSAWRFNFDPVPWDAWVLDGKTLFKGGRIIDIIKKHEITPLSEKEAADMAKYILFASKENFDAQETVESQEVSEKGGVFEVRLVVSRSGGTLPSGGKYIFFLKIGKGIYECGDEPFVPQKTGL